MVGPLDFLILHDIFYFGLIDAVIAMIYWGIVVYASTRPYEKNALKVTLNTIFPLFIVGFFASVLGFSSIFAGLLVIITFAFSLHYFSYIPWKKMVPIMIPMLFYLFVLFYIVQWLRTPLLLIYATMLFVKGKIEMRGKKKFES